MVRRIRKMPNRHAAALPGPSNFRKRYDDVERARIERLQRLAGLDARARAHPSFKHASTLLNQSFHKAKLAQRTGIR